MFDIFSALEHLIGRESENLSGGEMQMVAISRALLGSPGLVLARVPAPLQGPLSLQFGLQVVRGGAPVTGVDLLLSLGVQRIVAHAVLSPRTWRHGPEKCETRARSRVHNRHQKVTKGTESEFPKRRKKL